MVFSESFKIKTFVWLIGTFTEFYQADSGFIIGTIVLSSLSLLFGWRLVSKILMIVDIIKEKPLITVNADGIAILGDKFSLSEIPKND